MQLNLGTQWWWSLPLAFVMIELTIATNSTMSIPTDTQAEPNSTTGLRFNFGAQSGVQDWVPVLDQVMGGRSTGVVSLKADHLSFGGAVSLQNNGGFASLRSPTGRYDLSEFQQVSVRYRAVGLRFALTLNQHSEYYKPRFKAGLSSSNGQWQTETIALVDFKKVRLGEELAGQLSQKELANTIRIGLISDQKAEKEFELDLDYIEFK